MSAVRNTLWTEGASRGLLRSLLAAAILLPLAPEAARAGGGGEGVAVVVNADSWASLAVANEFIALRKVPPRNVIYLSGVGDFDRISVEDFRKGILQPVLEALEARKLTAQIDCIAYSSDLPTDIDLLPEASKENLEKAMPRQAKAITPEGSINGLTYLYKFVLAKDLRYVDPASNRYFRPLIRREGKPASQRAVAFHSQYAWNAEGSLAGPGDGTQYLLSTVLAVTSGRGNSVREAIASLQRAASADAARPKGTIYFMKNADVRSTTRDMFFASAAEDLLALGVSAEVLPGVLPPNKKDVAGLMTGAAGFEWALCGSTILPGAICDHFTSWGGVMREDAHQTPLTEFIRYGAAGACGTVTEPYAIAAKFPNAFLQVHYARGCSLAEAFYQSVAGPYQLLIVGDPLCQPWAKVPEVKIDCKTASGAEVNALPAPAAVTGKLTIRPMTADGNMEIGRYELFVDGLRQGECPGGESLNLDTDLLDEGFHELRVVGAVKDPIQAQGRAILPLRVSRGETKLFVTAPKEKAASWDAPFSIAARLVGGKRILFFQNERSIGTIEGAEGAAKIDLRKLGQGRVRIQPVGILAGKGGGEVRILGEPIELEVRPPIPSPAPALPGGEMEKGVLVSAADGRKVAVSKYTYDWLNSFGLRKDQDFQIQARFVVPDDDTYQFQLWTNLPLTMELDGRGVELPKGGGWKFLPVSLAKGTHSLLIKGKGVLDPRLDLRFGGRGAQNFVSTFRHVRAAGETAAATGPAK